MSGKQDGPRTGDGDAEQAHPITESAPDWVAASDSDSSEPAAESEGDTADKVAKDDASTGDDSDESDSSDGDKAEEKSEDAEKSDSTEKSDGDEDSDDTDADSKAAKKAKLRRPRPEDLDNDDPFGPAPPWLQRGTGRRSAIGIGLTLVLVAALAGVGWLLFGGEEEATAQSEETDSVACQVKEHPDEGLMIAPPQLGNSADRLTATVTTSHGDITVLLFGDVAPCGVSGFSYLATQGFYTNNPCYRITTQMVEPTVTLRCGDPQGTGNGGPGYRFQSEKKFEGRPGFDSFALINDPSGKAGSSFAFIRGQSIPTASLSVIGQVIAGFDVLDQIGASAGLDSYDGAPPQQVSILGVTIEEGTVTLPPTQVPGSPTGPGSGSPTATGDPTGPSTGPSTDPSGSGGPSLPGMPSLPGSSG
ncbi:cyclophilin family peptidyl-prolyl cis-trans isomerase [Stackebrandtia endophytica]|uniref:Cyclophilin family peptidyl-prolyl cis-trans isomerase n=1 Tax=Stackebrandtia endophytica TaxID=1496996 RepID=A0A543AYQ8_9ACTN|nr:peptidylprolyl isomerase [Stackebrandtia endophytica]TQL77703.1 cyclophilin family peptidyl-prolyl cis-trans isomerase [Stackebrandtia endophytica]